MPFINFDSDRVEKDMFGLLRQSEGVSEIEEALEIVGPPKMLLIEHFSMALSSSKDPRIKTFIKAIANGETSSNDYIDALKAFRIVMYVEQGERGYKHDTFFSASRNYAYAEDDYIVFEGYDDMGFGKEKRRYIRNCMYAGGKIYMFEGLKDIETRMADQFTSDWLSYYSNIKNRKFYVYYPDKMKRTDAIGSLFGEHGDETGTSIMMIKGGDGYLAAFNWAKYDKLGTMRLNRISGINKEGAERIYQNLHDSNVDDNDITNKDYVKMANGGSLNNLDISKPLALIGEKPGNGRFILITSNSTEWASFLDDYPISFGIEASSKNNSVETGIYQIVNASFQKIEATSGD
ncbi:MAG: hypothetical protein QXN59_01395 [Candidatus Micrarchaeaceae archaeon]